MPQIRVDFDGRVSMVHVVVRDDRGVPIGCALMPRVYFNMLTTTLNYQCSFMIPLYDDETRCTH